MIECRWEPIYGVGINDAEDSPWSYDVDGKLLTCPYFERWRAMLQRCYCLKSYHTYKDCSVVEQWWTFTVFKSWMQTQDWEGKELDKDLLVRGNKVYGPNTCLFVTQAVNNFLLDCNKRRGEYPIGVYFEKARGKFKAVCCSVLDNKQKTLGRYGTPEQAHQAWLAFKVEQAYILANLQTDDRVAKALVDRYEKYND
jgi:hypothetical protein